jgi:hypothetical protein
MSVLSVDGLYSASRGTAQWGQVKLALDNAAMKDLIAKKL